MNLETNDAVNDDDMRPYCFRYTWLGPKFSSVQLKNRTCAALMGRAELICVQPLIITSKFKASIICCYLVAQDKKYLEKTCLEIYPI